MKTIITLCLTLVLLLGASAQASNFYLIEDSDTRLLTRSELWEWQYDALGYVFNEIFARHGYHFEAGGKYESYFKAQDWYEENETYATNQEIYHNLMTSIDWQNERLCKEVRAVHNYIEEGCHENAGENAGGQHIPGDGIVIVDTHAADDINDHNTEGQSCDGIHSAVAFDQCRKQGIMRICSIRCYRRNCGAEIA